MSSKVRIPKNLINNEARVASFVGMFIITLPVAQKDAPRL